MKVLIYDLETTGLTYKSSIHQMSGMLVIDDEIVEKFNYKLRPFTNALLEPSALEIGNVTAEQIMGYPDQKEAYKSLMKILDSHVNKYDKTDKIFLSGYNNAKFDDDFLRRFFNFNGNKFFGSYFWSVSLDVIILANYHLASIRHTLPDFQLSTIAKVLNIPVATESLHDALYDVELTYKILKRLNLSYRPTQHLSRVTSEAEDSLLAELFNSELE